MKKEFLRLVKHTVLLIVGSALIGTLLLTLVHCLPTGRVRQHAAADYGDVIKSPKDAHQEGFAAYIRKNKETFTDCIMVQYALEKIPGKNAFEHAMWAYHSDLADGVVWDAEDSLKAILDGKEPSEMYLREYSRYWHGYLVYLKPLLMLFSWRGLLIAGIVLQLLLMTAVCAAAVYKKQIPVAVALLGGCLYLKPALILASFDMSVCWIITLAVLLVMLLRHEWLAQKDLFPELFLCAGILTSYFDFLTYPTVTLGFPLCAYFLLRKSKDIKGALKAFFGFGALWSVGYAGMWSCKWIIADLTLRTGTIKNALWTVLGITSGISGHSFNARIYGGFHAINLNLQEYDHVYYPILTVLLGIGVIAALIRAVRGKVSVRRILSIAAPYLLTALIPFAWIMTAQFHSAVHARFTFRILSIAVMAVLGLILSLWNEGEDRKTDLLFLSFVLLLALYPLRKVHLGVDLWDGGYNYTNFRYPGTDYMDPMWYFATWISTQAGRLLMHLPFAGTMLGMNVYTGLLVSLLAVAGFVFCVKKLGMSRWLAALGELTACGLCWAPTSVLYNYLTFLLLTFAVILLYLGLTEEKERYLAAAGVLLGLNVGVRFSNLPQMGLILAVWFYCLLGKKSLRETFKKTGFCMLGYAAALGSFLLVMAFWYGIGTYVHGIARLFAMTKVAQDYSPLRMMKGVFAVYLDQSYWIKRFGLALLIGAGICLAVPGKFPRVKKGLCVAVTGVLFYWLLTHLFYYPDFATYEAIHDPCVMLLFFALILAGIFLVKKGVDRKDRLLALLEALLILLIPIGGNNAAYYNINNMFLTLPIALYFLGKLWSGQESLVFFSFRTVMTALCALVCLLALRFGNTFVYEEATGGRQMDRVITEIPVLRGMRTGGEKAAELTQLYAFLTENEMTYESCILYGSIPGISYYMGLRPAFSVWGDLRSYTPDIMEADLDRLRLNMAKGERAPVVIVESGWTDYMEQGGEIGASWDETAIEKARLLWDYMEQNGYAQEFRNGKFVVYRTFRKNF